MTKHSKKIAEAISEELKVPAENVKSNPSAENTDLMFIVGGVYGGESLPEMLAYVKSLGGKVKKAVLITSCASKTKEQKTVRDSLTELGIEVLGEYICQGSFLLAGMGHPNKKEIREAVEFALKMVK
jgi:flavodoxin